MTPEQIERVFGRGRVKMATGAHVEVFREAVPCGERRRYTKRFLVTDEADFGAWTEREWRILARLIGHGILCVPDVVQFDAGTMGGMRRVQTYDAGITVDQWATLLPVSRDGVVRRSVFDDCAHWWALAHHCLAALNEIHALQLVHLDIKGDNLCIPYGPPHFDPDARETTLYAVFARLALIDFAFSLVSGERLGTPLPIGWQKDYDYQSPRLLAALEAGRSGDLRPTQELDWRCDLYSLAAMLRRYLPDADDAHDESQGDGWTASRYDDARALIYRLRACHDRDLPLVRPHQELMDYTGARVRERDLAFSLTRGWTLARDVSVTSAPMPLTPLTRVIAPSQIGEGGREMPRIVLPTVATAVIRRPRARVATRATAVIRRPRVRLPDSPALIHTAPVAAPSLQETVVPLARALPPAATSRRHWRAAGVASVIGAAAALAAPSFIGDPDHPLNDGLQHRVAALTRSVSGDFPMPTKTSLPEATSNSAAPSEATSTTTKDTPAVEARNEVADAKPAAEPAAVERSTSVPNRVHATSRVEARRSTPAPASSTHATNVAKASRAPATRFALHGSTPPVVAASVAKPARPTAAIPRTEIAGASPSRVETETATPSPATPAAPNPPEAAQASAAHGESAPTHASATPNPESRNQSTPSPRERSNAKTRPTGPLADLLKMFAWHQKAAPVEERHLGSSKPVEKSAPRPRAPEPIQLADATASTPTGPAQVITSPMAPATFPTTNNAISPTPAQPIDVAASVTETHPVDSDEDQLAMRGRQLVTDVVPGIAASAYDDLSPALSIISSQADARQDRAVVSALRAPWRGEARFVPTTTMAPPLAKRLHEDARNGYAHGRRVDDVLHLELAAFAANPRDPDIAAFLAFLHLHANPANPETARQLALHAIAMSGAQRTQRVDDWGTLAIASALAGRHRDATRLFLVEVALAVNIDRSCRAALNAYNDYGEPLRVPVQTMLARVQSDPRAYEYPSCTDRSASMASLRRTPL